MPITLDPNKSLSLHQSSFSNETKEKSFELLPKEIIREIFFSLSEDTLRKCRRVCKLWLAIAIDERFLKARGFDLLNFPGTISYVQNNIPLEVQQKAALISELRERVLEREAPDLYNGVLGIEIMTIPVFDASHPDIQSALDAANAPNGTTTALNKRDIRHYMGHDEFEQHLVPRWAYGEGGFPVNIVCPVCLHPGYGKSNISIDRTKLRIDTALQDEILLWAQAAHQ